MPSFLNRRQLIASSMALASIAATGAGSGSQRRPGTTASYRAWEMGERTNGVNLRMAAREARAPQAGEVLLKVHATGLNARDLTLLRGIHIYGGSNGPASRIPLDDNACEVLTAGVGVTRVGRGDRVVCTHFPLWLDGPWDDTRMSTLDFSVNTDGFLAEQVIVPAQGLVKLPDSISYEAASTLPNAGLTAWHAVVEEAKVQRGETLLTLGTGGVSMFGMQWAKLRGARTIVTSSSDAKLARVRELGADLTVNYRNTPEWHTEALALTQGRGVDVVLNTVGISEMERCLNACASNGRVMLIGANSVSRNAGSSEAAAGESSGLRQFPRSMLMRALTIKGIIVGSRRMLEDVVTAVDQCQIQPVIDRVFEFEQVPQAVSYMESGGKIGKIVIRVG